eukprot:TRINITY_DN1818_c0_g1_i1.p1 TRINITY_DN1818_c0_g1~~TRINITY_DN1818_c0_g1_i1.p1  ORF type:complete len:457 (-),score=129.25 TRINITY_DN1818_c0_g1_i1:223-1593(-)
MRHVFFFVSLFILSVSCRYHFSHENVGDYPVQYYQQTLDHFNSGDIRTFKQRFWANYDHFNQSAVDAPIFLYINGEGMIYGPPSSNNSLVVQLAKEHSGVIVTLEHRFYGESHYFNQLTTENLRYLDSEQALEDLSEFITWFRTQVRNEYNIAKSPLKIFTIGVSYSGALSAWFRIKYPHITSGSLSSSGVVNAIKDFGQYDGQVPVSVGLKCTNALRSVTKTIQAAIDRGNSTYYKLKFNATRLNDADFNYMIGDIGATLVQYGRRKDLCDPLVKVIGEKAIMDAFIQLSSDVFFKSFGTVESYDVKFISNTSVVPKWNGRQWWYQTCTEFGWFQTAAKSGGIRSKSVNLDYFLGFCKQVFGLPLDPVVEKTNARYGGNKPAGTRIYFANGSQDPWQWASVRKDLNEFEPARVLQCDNCGHGCDVGGCPGGCNPAKARDDAITEIKGFVAYWLKI